MFKKSAVIMGLALLVGCSDTEVPTKTKETVSVPSVPVESTVSKPDITTPLEDYNLLLKGPLSGLSDSMDQFSVLTSQAAEDSSVLFTDDWKVDMALTLTLMEEYINQAQKINPPAEMAEVHDLLLEGLDYYQYVVDNFPTAIDNLDADLIGECTTAMENGTIYVTQATDKLNSMK